MNLRIIIHILFAAALSAAEKSASQLTALVSGPSIPVAGKYVIMGEDRILGWARAQGFEITADNKDGGLESKRAFLISPPGISFDLHAPADHHGDRSQVGHTLVLDIGAFKRQEKKEILSSDVSFYENILRFNVYADHMLLGTVEMGYGVTVDSPVRLPIPYIFKKSGRVRIKIEMTNHPSSFAVLYDARIAAN